MKEILKILLEQLEQIGEDHEEIYDSDVRQSMSNAIVDGFVRHVPGFAVPEEFGMFSEEGDSLVSEAIGAYIAAANERALSQKLMSFHERLSAVQDDSVRTATGLDYEELLGQSPPELFDADGNVISVE